jgi:hypothetical protein
MLKKRSSKRPVEVEISVPDVAVPWWWKSSPDTPYHGCGKLFTPDCVMNVEKYFRVGCIMEAKRCPIRT